MLFRSSFMFTANMQGAEKAQAYLDAIEHQALYLRDVGVTVDDHILLLTTCSSDITNGRNILVAKITDEIYPNTFFVEEEKTVQAKIFERMLKFPMLQIIIGGSLTLLILLVIFLYKKDKKDHRQRSKENDVN